MKRLFIILATTIVAMGASAALMTPIADVKADMQHYKYAYVIPTSNVTASSGVSHAMPLPLLPIGGVYGNATNTANPAEEISGYLIKMGYNILPSIVPELAEQTLIFSYGHIEKRRDSQIGFVSHIIIQISDGKTYEMLATFEAEGNGSDESMQISTAIRSALNYFSYIVSPTVLTVAQYIYSTRFELRMTNCTPNKIHHVELQVSYYLDGKLVHKQIEHINKSLMPGEEALHFIRRDKQARSNKLQIKLEVISYE